MAPNHAFHHSWMSEPVDPSPVAIAESQSVDKRQTLRRTGGQKAPFDGLEQGVRFDEPATAARHADCAAVRNQRGGTAGGNDLATGHSNEGIRSRG